MFSLFFFVLFFVCFPPSTHTHTHTDFARWLFYFVNFFFYIWLGWVLLSRPPAGHLILLHFVFIVFFFFSSNDSSATFYRGTGVSLVFFCFRSCVGNKKKGPQQKKRKEGRGTTIKENGRIHQTRKKSNSEKKQKWEMNCLLFSPSLSGAESFDWPRLFFLNKLPSFLLASLFFFQWGVPSFTRFYWVLLFFSGFYWVSPGFNGFCPVLLGYMYFLVGFTGFYLVLPSFT